MSYIDCHDVNSYAAPEYQAQKLDYLEPEEETTRDDDECAFHTPSRPQAAASVERVSIERISEPRQLPYLHKSGTVLKQSQYWPWPMVDHFLILDGFNLAVYTSKESIPTKPLRMISLLGKANVEKVANEKLTLRVSDEDGNWVDFAFTNAAALDEWLEALDFTIRASPGFQRMTPQDSFMWVYNSRAPKTDTAEEESDLEHFTALKDIQMNLLTSKVEQFESQESRRRLLWNSVVALAGVSTAGLALWQKRDFIKPQIEALCRNVDKLVVDGVANLKAQIPDNLGEQLSSLFQN